MLLTVVLFLEMSCGSWHRFCVQEFGKVCQCQYEIYIYSSIHRSCCCSRDKIRNMVNDPAIRSCLVSEFVKVVPDTKGLYVKDV